MAVFYRYQNEYGVTIKKGKSFTVEPNLINITRWQLTAKATSILDGQDYLIIAIPLSWFTIPIGEISSHIASFYYPNTFTTEPGNRWEFRYLNHYFSFRTFGLYENNPHFKPWEGRAISTSADSITYEWREEYIYRYTGRKIYVFPEPPTDFFWYPANGDRTWIFRIFDHNENQIFSREDARYPKNLYTVEDTCPANTCSVDCGDKICCYCSDGIATDFYYK